MSEEEKKFLIPVAASTNPSDLGSLVREALQKNYSVTISAGTAGSITLAAVEQAKEGKEIKEVEVRLGPSWFGFTIKGEKNLGEQVTSSIRKIIAREGLLLIGVFIGAFVIAQNQSLQDWVTSLGIATPHLPAQVLRDRYGASELGGMILNRATIISFLSIVVLYGPHSTMKCNTG